MGRGRRVHKATLPRTSPTGSRAWQDERDVFRGLPHRRAAGRGAGNAPVRLPSGGSLVIDKTEAMTVIDVTAGKFHRPEREAWMRPVTRSNLEAAEEIARQLRLRDIGGIVVVDFIDMVLESNRELVLERLGRALGQGTGTRRRLEVTSFGLVKHRQETGSAPATEQQARKSGRGGRGTIPNRPSEKAQLLLGPPRHGDGRGVLRAELVDVVHRELVSPGGRVAVRAVSPSAELIAVPFDRGDHVAARRCPPPTPGSQG